MVKWRGGNRIEGRDELLVTKIDEASIVQLVYDDEHGVRKWRA